MLLELTEELAMVKKRHSRRTAGIWQYNPKTKQVIVESHGGRTLELMFSIEQNDADFICNAANQDVEWMIKRLEEILEAPKEVVAEPITPPVIIERVKVPPNTEPLTKEELPVKLPDNQGSTSPILVTLMVIGLFWLGKTFVTTGANYALCKQYFKEMNVVACAVSGVRHVKRVE